MTTPTVPFKQAAINWILTHGKTGTAMYGVPSTAEALHLFETKGIDYELSDAPSFSVAIIDHGDTDNGATTMEAITAKIVVKGSERWSDGAIEFFVRPEAFQEMLLGVVIMGVVANADGAQEWTQRYPQERQRIREMEAADAERLAARQAAYAKQKAQDEQS